MTMKNKRPGTDWRVAVVDDHPMVRRGLCDLIAEEPGFAAVGEAETPEETLALIESAAPDILLVDISLETGSGLELIKQVHALHPEVNVLVFSMHDESIYAERALRAGASGYVEKQSPTEQLLEAMRKVARGKIHVSEEMTERLLQQRLEDGLEAGASVADRLSDRELEVFELLGRGRTTREIASDLNISVKTVERHCENIKESLQLANRTQLLQRAVHWLLSQTQA